MRAYARSLSISLSSIRSFPSLRRWEATAIAAAVEMTTKRKLYMARNMAALNESVAVPQNVKNPRTLAQSALKMHQLAGEAFECRDEERAYVFFMRYLNLVTCVKKTTDFRTNPQFYKDLLGNNNMKDSIVKVRDARSMRGRISYMGLDRC